MQYTLQYPVVGSYTSSSKLQKEQKVQSGKGQDKNVISSPRFMTFMKNTHSFILLTTENKSWLYLKEEHSFNLYQHWRF